MLIPSTLDDSLAPPGQHVASLFCQHVAPDAAGRPLAGTTIARACADLMIDTVDAHAPGFKASVLGRHDPVAAGPGAHLRPGRRRHHARRAVAGSAVLAPARCWATATTARRSRAFICAAPEPIPAAASPARRATTPRARSWPTAACSAGCSEGDRARMSEPALAPARGKRRKAPLDRRQDLLSIAVSCLAQMGPRAPRGARSAGGRGSRTACCDTISNTRTTCSWRPTATSATASWPSSRPGCWTRRWSPGRRWTPSSRCCSRRNGPIPTCWGLDRLLDPVALGPRLRAGQCGAQQHLRGLLALALRRLPAAWLRGSTWRARP